MPMETARGIIQIESGKNYYWRASRGRAGSFRGRICEYEEEKRSCRSQVEVGGGGGGGRISRRGEGERKLEREKERGGGDGGGVRGGSGGGNDLAITTSPYDPLQYRSMTLVSLRLTLDVITLMSISFSSSSSSRPDAFRFFWSPHLHVEGYLTRFAFQSLNSRCPCRLQPSSNDARKAISIGT